MATIIFPTENDIGVSAGDGDIGNEEHVSSWGENLRMPTSLVNGSTTVGRGAVIGGFEYLFDSGLTATIANGFAQIGGYRIEEDNVAEISLTASRHNHLFLKLEKSSGKVTGAAYEVNATTSYGDFGTVPGDSILLWSFQTDGSSVTSIKDYRAFAGATVIGRYVGNGVTGDRDVILGFKPKSVIIQKTSFPRIWSLSEVGYALDSGNNVGMVAVQRSSDEMVHVQITSTSNARLRAAMRTNGAGFSIQSVSGGATIELTPKVFREQFSYDPNNLVGGDDRVDTFGDFSQTELNKGEPLFVGHDQITDADIQITGWVENLFPLETAGVTVRLLNHGAGGINIADGTLTVAWFEPAADANLKVDLNTTGEVYHFVAFS